MAGENWRKQNKTIASRLKLVLHKQILTDVVFEVQGKEFRCHSLILAIGSSYFERTFYHTFRRGDLPKDYTLTISDVTPEAFQRVITYLYTDELTFGNEEQAFQTYEAAAKFEMDDLKAECEIYLSELDFAPRTIWNNLGRAADLKMEKMERRYMAYLEKNTERCLREEAFLKADEGVLMKVLQAEKLAISEIALLKRVAAWGKYQRSHSPDALPLKPFLCYIRFSAMTASEFCSFIENNPTVIDARDSIAIIECLRDPLENTLPGWCCRHPRRAWP